MLNRLLVALALLVAVVAWAQAPAPDLTLPFKPLFPKLGGYPLLSGGLKEGAVSLDESDFVKEKPSVRLDCTKTKDRVISLGCYIHPNNLAPYRGQAVVFRVMLKWLQGDGKVTLQMRASGEKTPGTVAQQVVFAGERGKWVPFELHAVVPPAPELNIVNFMVWLENSPTPPVVLVDEPTILADTQGAGEQKPATAASGFAAYAAPASKEPLVLVREGLPAASIVIAEPATPTVKYALQELQEHLKLSSGATLPVVADGKPVTGPTIHIGKTALTTRLGLAPEFFAPDNWTVRRVGDALILAGGDTATSYPPNARTLFPYGTLYATYEFLERALGVRWYWPGELGRIVPKHPTVSLGNIAWGGAPSYDTRFAFYAIPKDPALSARDIESWWRRMRWGGVNGSPIGMHSFNRWPERFGDQHPEWFALQRNGQRAAKDPGGYVCFSNPEVFAQTVKDAREYLTAHPESRYVTIMPGDGGFECQCKDCQAQGEFDLKEQGRWSKLVWNYVNNVAAEIRKTHPDRIVTCCAYSSYRLPPESVHLLPNIAITLCTNYLPHVYKPEAKSEYLAELDGWARKGVDVYAWDYWYARRGAGTYGAPSVFPHAMQEWFALERGRVKGRVIELCEFYSDGRSSHDWADWMMDALDMYVAMRLMWNVDTDVNAMLSEYYTQLYGPAAPLIEKFYTELENALADPATKGDGKTWDWSVCWLKTYPSSLVQRTMGYLREAEKLTRGQEPYHARVAMTLTGFLPFEASSQKYSGAANAAVKNDRIAVPLSATAPAIDGKLDEACWQSAALADGFFDMFNNPQLRSQTTMRVLRDKDRLYFGIRAPLETAETKQTVTPNSRDGNVWDDESCEVFLTQGPRLIQFLLGPNDIYADVCNPDTGKPFDMAMFAWNCAGVQYKTVKAANEWTAEMAIPLASLEMTAPTEKDPWKVNFCRNYYYRIPGSVLWQWETSSWRPTFGSFHNLDRFGTLVFK